jgi:hypothetical protein
MPELRDARGQLVIGPPRGVRGQELITAGATQIVFDKAGNRRGVYVDCEAGSGTVNSPEQRRDRDAIALRLRGMITATEKVWVTLYPDEAGHSISGCITMLLWFAGWGAAPVNPGGYCLWWDFVPPGSPPATLLSRARVLLQLEGRTPPALWVY